MNDKFTNTNPEDSETARKLQAIAEQTHTNPHFMAELESKLKESYKPKNNWSMPGFKKIVPAFGWAALVIVFGLALSWSIRNLIPTPQPGTGATPNGFVCPVTQPNGSTPPFEQTSTYHHGNGKIWTDLWPNGKVYLTPADKNPDGTFSMKWVWWRNASGTMDIQGHRLDAASEQLRVIYPGGYDDAGVYVVALTFPTTGCWEVTALAGESSLTFVTEVVFGEATPTPDLAASQNTITIVNATPVPDDGSYAWRNTTMYLAQPLPQSPTVAQVYPLKLNQPTTVWNTRRGSRVAVRFFK